MELEKFVEKKVVIIDQIIMRFMKQHHKVNLVVKYPIEQLFIDDKCVLSIDNDKYDIKEFI